MKAICCLLIASSLCGCSARYYHSDTAVVFSYRLLDKSAAEDIEVRIGKQSKYVKIKGIKSDTDSDAVQAVTEGAVRGLVK